MEGYLGDTPVDIASHPTFASMTPDQWAMLFIEKYGQIDGAHHKAWVLDQVSRILKGTPVIVSEARWSNGKSEYRFDLDEPSPAFLAWRDEMLGGTDAHGEREYGYDEGIAP
jgi:hypothetical protein